MKVGKTQCSFCDRWSDEVPFMVEASATVHICSLCVEEFLSPPEDMLVDETEGLACAFCGKTYPEADYLVQGFSESTVCNSCVKVAKTLVEENQSQ